MTGKICLYILIAICTVATGCIFGAGTHGSIKGYQYATKKDSLQKAIMAVIKNNPNIYRDTSLDYLGSSPLLDHSDAGDYSAGENYYNDIKHYVTITISSGHEKNEYTFRYYGDDEDWKTSYSSKIFICYAHDQNGKGGSEGGGGLEWYRSGLKKKFTDLFEKELISKVDKELNLPHAETE
jgi:hypothetical protein